MCIFSEAVRRLLKEHWRNFAVFAVSLGFLLLLQHLQSHHRREGVYFHVWDSDTLQQTLPIQALKDHPLQSLWYLHIQPPILDVIRSGLAWLHRDLNGVELLHAVDQSAYFVWAIFYALLSVLVFSWIRTSSSLKAAYVGTALWILHPTPITFTVLLDSTLLSSLLISWFLFEAWLLYQKRGSLWRMMVAVTLAALTRTIFQYYFIFPLVVSALLLRVQRRTLMMALLIPILFFGGWVVRQYALFGTLATTTFQGYHKAGVISFWPEKSAIDAAVRSVTLQYPEEADRFSGGDPFNTKKQAIENLAYQKLSEAEVRKHPLKSAFRLGRSIIYNAYHYWKPYSWYNPNELTYSLLWPPIYQWIFSRYTFPLMLVGAAYAWLRRNWKHLQGEEGFRLAGFLLPLAYILLISHLCNRGMWTEADRMKFFLEPSFFVFLVTQSARFFEERKVYMLPIHRARTSVFQLR